MATVQTTVENTHAAELDLVGLVNREATWKEILIELVDKNQLNPWEIDLVYIIDRYVDTVKRMKVIDLRVPANIILAAAILLRLKSSILSLEEEEAEMPPDEAPFERPVITVEGLNFRLRLPPKRRISLKELIDALEEAIKVKENRMTSTGAQIQIPISIDNFDIELEADRVYGIIQRNMDRSNMVTFSNLSRLNEFNDILLELFIPLLFLAHDGKILLLQEKFFDEILISLNKAS
ncbi:MAG: segregation/condensation protein A [Candidatus Micrarchaeota archaeon]|nr:segregation/condensation protein A [Candidatus Micrarchaeota archaeon]